MLKFNYLKRCNEINSYFKFVSLATVLNENENIVIEKWLKSEKYKTVNTFFAKMAPPRLWRPRQLPAVPVPKAGPVLNTSLLDNSYLRCDLIKSFLLLFVALRFWTIKKQWVGSLKVI